MNAFWMRILTFVLPYVIKWVFGWIEKHTDDEQEKVVGDAAKKAAQDQLAKIKEKKCKGPFAKFKKECKK